MRSQSKLNAIFKLIYMKKSILTLMMILPLYWSCQKNDTTDYSTMLLGTWVNTIVDNQLIPTNTTFVMQLRSDKVELYANGNTVDKDNKTWIENDKYSYSVSANVITIDGVGALGGSFHMEFKIRSVDALTLCFSVSKFMIDNVEYPDPKIYTLKKVITDPGKQFVGTWYGKSTTPGSVDNNYHYWEYFADGHFNYYYQDVTGQWFKKLDNEGHYFLYGDFLATNFTNDLLTGGSGKAYECWNINILGNTMFWTGIRENNQLASFRMDRVQAPPALH